ncbi:MAG TPA: MFS transporter, partial [Patescibacteria group bacterium]|nr:MFS transporter [Patescibacteria group bacterium]
LGFYNTLLHDLATTRTKESLSGIGTAVGYFGLVVGLGLAYPFTQGTLSFFGFSGKPTAFIIGALAFLLFSLPVFFFLKDKKDETPASEIATFGKSFGDTFRDIKNIRQYPGVLAYLISYYLYSDAILTLQLFAVLYLDKVAHLADSQKNIAFATGLFFGVVGAGTSRWLALLMKSTRKAVALCIALWAVLLVALGLVSNPYAFIVIVVLNGFFSGALFSLSRAYYSHLVPAEKQGQYFGIYVLFERFASILGPLIWSLTIIAFAFLGEAASYRAAMLSLGVMVAIGFVIFLQVKDPRTKE